MPKPHIKWTTSWIALLPLLFLCAGPALATVAENPVRVRLVGGLPAVERGNLVTLTLEFSSKTTLDLNNISLDTDGWEIESPPAARLQIVAGQAQRITVTVRALDPDQPLRLRYSVGGESFEDYFDLSVRIRDSQRPGTLTRITDPALIESLNQQLDTQSVRPEPGPQPSQDARSRFEPQGDVDRNDTLRTYSTERDIRVVGYFRYQRPDGQGAGVDGAVARIFDEDTGWDELLAEQTLGPDGRFDITFHWDPCFTCDGQPDIYVEFNLENSKVNVQVNGTNDTYNWNTGVWGDYGGNYLDVGVNLPNVAWQMPACNIMTQMMRAWRFLYSTGRDCGKIDVQWPDNMSCPTACYRSASQEIHVPSAREWDENTLVHEYGHHFVYSFATGTTPDYCNSICDSPGNCGHCIWCRETDHDAFNEGFPNYLADAVLRTYQSVYGLGPVTARFDQENLYFCTTTLDDPWTTEGFLGALMVDIDDSAQDDQASQPAGIDEMNLGYDEIINVVDNSAPTTPAGFLNAFKSTYPGQTEALWATARNNGYDIDNFLPGTVSNLGSDHTLNQNWDTRAYITWSWNRASDDASGVVAYSYTVSSSYPGMPDQTAELGNVTSVRTGPHPAGWYYIAIRAQDRAGKWSNNYVVQGPYGIRTPDPANLKMQVHSNWAYLAVTARHQPDVVTYAAQAPSVLYGWTNSYISVDYNNAGETASGQYWVVLFMDSGFLAPIYRFGTPPGVYDPILNEAVQIPGGRHTIGAFLDETEALAEPIETDNVWAHQWSWQPSTLNEAAPYYSNLLQPRYAGTEWVVDGSAIYPNSTGYRLVSAYNTNQYWTALSVHSDSQADYDIFVHSPSTNPATEFTSTLMYANAGVGATDIMLWNGGWIGASYAWDIGINNYSGGGYYGGTGSYVQKKLNAFLTLPGSSAAALAADEMVRLWQFNCPGGRMFMKLQLADPAQGPLNLTLVPSSFTYGPLRGAGTTVTTDASGQAYLDLNLLAGAPCIAVWRDSYQGHGPVNFTISLEQTPADLSMIEALPSGWQGNAFVPRPDQNVTATQVPPPPYLIGDANATWLNYFVSNRGATGVAGGTLSTTFLGDGQMFNIDYHTSPNPNSKIFVNLTTPFYFPGGRHVLAAYADMGDAVPEITSSNNFTARQWVWMPAVLPMDVSSAFSTPPSVFGGWALMPSGSPLWFNLNGTRTPVPPGPDGSGNGWRLGVAAMPDPGTDVDLKLFEVATTATTGFDTELAGSYWGPDQVDFCLVDFHNTAPRAFDVGLMAPAVQAGGSRVQIRTSKYLGAVTASPSGPVRPLSARTGRVKPSVSQYGTFALGVGDLFELYEIDLAAGTYTISLVPSNIALGMAVYPPGTTYVGKSGSVPDGTVWGDTGEPMSITITVNVAGSYAIAVWKNLPTQVENIGTFVLQVAAPQTGIPEDGHPVKPLAVQASPNPFAASTNLMFTLGDSRAVDIQIFDVSGREVRHLSAGVQGAGSHTVTWDGNDDTGRALPAGFYFVRTTAGSWIDEKKIVRIR